MILTVLRFVWFQMAEDSLQTLQLPVSDPMTPTRVFLEATFKEGFFPMMPHSMYCLPLWPGITLVLLTKVTCRICALNTILFILDICLTYETRHKIQYMVRCPLTFGHHTCMWFFPKMQPKSWKHTTVQDIFVCCSIRIFLHSNYRSQHDNCSQSEGHEDMVCQGWCRGSQVACKKPWPQHHWIPLGWTRTLITPQYSSLDISTWSL